MADPLSGKIKNKCIEDSSQERSARWPIRRNTLLYKEMGRGVKKEEDQEKYEEATSPPSMMNGLPN